MQYSLTWEWGVIMAGQLVFLVAAELYKLWKRRSPYWNDPKATPTGVHLGEGDEIEHERTDEVRRLSYLRLLRRRGSNIRCSV
jgi:hypothetical protein